MRVMLDCRKALDFGIGRYIRGLVSGFSSFEHDVHLLLVGPSEARESMEPLSDVEWIDDHSPHYSFRELHRIGRLAKTHRADVLHSPHYVTPMSEVPVVVTIHDLIHLHQPLRNPVAKLYAHWMLRRAARSSAAIIAVSNAIALEIERELGADPAKIFVSPNGVDDQFFHEPRAREDREPILLFVGNDKPHKNLARLIEAFESSTIEAKLLIVGSKRAESPRVRSLGYVTEPVLVELYRSVTAVVAPSLEEGFCLPAVEAMAAGTPVIASDLPVLREVTTGNAIFFDPNSTESMRDAIEEIFRGRIWDELSSRGPEVARALRWAGTAKKTLAVYRDAVTRIR